MEYVKLGNTDLSVSKITFGCWEMGGTQWEFTNDENNINAVRKALSLGITSFDTAEGYGNGHSEEVLGKALGAERKNIVLATKVSNTHLKPQDLADALKNSLKRLNTDYLDVYYIHWPSFQIPLADTIGAMVKLKEQGLIRAIGLSNFDIGLLTEAMSYGRIDAIQPEYSLLHRAIEAEVLPWCVENNVSVMSYSSIAKGILAGVFHVNGVKLSEDDFRAPRRLFTKEDLEKETPIVNLVKNIAEQKGVSMSQVAIAWLLAKPGMTSAIVGTQNEKHLIDNLKAVDLSLTAQEAAQLDATSAEVLMAIDGGMGTVAQIPSDNVRIR